MGIICTLSIIPLISGMISSWTEDRLISTSDTGPDPAPGILLIILPKLHTSRRDEKNRPHLFLTQR